MEVGLRTEFQAVWEAPKPVEAMVAAAIKVDRSAQEAA